MANKAPTKSAIYAGIAESTGLNKKQVAEVFDALTEMIGDTIDPDTPFTIPGLCKIVVQHKEAQPEREGINPFTKEPAIFKAKPARNVVKVRPLKGLKDLAAASAPPTAAAPAAPAAPEPPSFGGGGGFGG